MLFDKNSFELLFRENYAELVNFGFKYVKDQDVAEELVQSMFLNLWEKSAKIEIRTSIKSYMFGAVRNAALNHIKHQKVTQSYADAHQHLGVSNHDDPLEYDELKEKIDMALQRIPEKCREIFELSRFEGKRYKEIAEELGISLKTVENQMGKALRILREELGEYLPLLLFFLTHGGKL